MGFESNQVWLFFSDGLLIDQFYALFDIMGVILHAQIYLVFIIMEIASISLQFIYRYLLLIQFGTTFDLNKLFSNFQIGFRRYMILLLIPFMAIMSLYTYFSFVLYPESKFNTGFVNELSNVIDLNKWKLYLHSTQM